MNAKKIAAATPEQAPESIGLALIVPREAE